MSEAAEVNDEALLQRIVDGNNAAFELFFRRHYSRVFQFVHRMLRQRDLVEEVVDDTFFAVWQGAASFAGQSAITTWLLGIGYRQALKAIERQQRAHRLEGGEDDLDTIIDLQPENDPQEIVAAQKLCNQLTLGIAQLSPDHQAVLDLVATGHSAPEIAEIMGCPEATVRTRLFHARAQLRDFLARTQAVAIKSAAIGASARQH